LSNQTDSAISFVDVDTSVFVTNSFFQRHFSLRFEQKLYNKRLPMKQLSILPLVASCALFAEAPTTIAIHNARVIPVSGPAIPRGNVILRNGLIEAVGTDVAVPADAWVIEGDGLTVYPGLIDALSTFGIPEAATAIPAGGGRGQRRQRGP
jgi:hypothetical protein